MIVNDKQFSDDGYIIDQDLFEDYPYRTCSTAWCGCGWIAAYNLRHALGQDVYFDDVRKEMDAMHTERVPGPTLMRVMRAYLEKYVPGYRETVGQKDAPLEAVKSRAGIFRYTEGIVPHYIAYVHVKGTEFRFFNVNDDIIDGVFDMRDFAREHFKINSVIALTVDREEKITEETPSK